MLSAKFSIVTFFVRLSLVESAWSDTITLFMKTRKTAHVSDNSLINNSLTANMGRHMEARHAVRVDLGGDGGGLIKYYDGRAHIHKHHLDNKYLGIIGLHKASKCF